MAHRRTRPEPPQQKNTCLLFPGMRTLPLSKSRIFHSEGGYASKSVEDLTIFNAGPPTLD